MPDLIAWACVLDDLLKLTDSKGDTSIDSSPILPALQKKGEPSKRGESGQGKKQARRNVSIENLSGARRQAAPPKTINRRNAEGTAATHSSKDYTHQDYKTIQGQGVGNFPNFQI